MPRGKRDNPKHPIDRGAPASVIADKFGGLKAFTDALTRARAENGGKPVAMSTVHRWLVRGTINGRDHDDVLRAARLSNVKLKDADFVDRRPPEERGASVAEPVAANA